jgi:F-type H+-transporting ATPase subunit alpha
LTTHAHAYREIALVANRFPGRDAYPGDIFYTHSRLLERAGNFKTSFGEISITVLPVAEVVEGDLAGYITTNLMSMTDGHIFFDGNLYFEGRRPAVNIPLSVTRVGRQAQTPLFRSINREVGAFLRLYESVQNLSHFGAELSATVLGTLKMGENIYRFFDQDGEDLMPTTVVAVVFALIWLNFVAGTTEEIERVKKAVVKNYQTEFGESLCNEAVKRETLNELLQFVSSHKEEFMTLCKTENS